MKHFLLIFCAIVLPGCAFLGTTEELELRFPSRQDNLFDGFIRSWELQYLDEKGEPASRIFSSDDCSILISVEKGIPAFFSLKAFVSINGTHIETKPAGFLYPLDRTGTSGGNFSWESGFLSRLLLDLSPFMDVSLVNVSRLMKEIRREAGGEDLWDIDGSAIAQELAGGDFSVYDIRLQREREVEAEIPEGLWMNCSPLGRDIQVLPDSTGTQLKLRTGYHRYISTSGSILEIYIYSDGSWDSIVY